MIRSPIGLHLEDRPGLSLRDSIQQTARLGANGVLLDATGELSPDRLTETGRRDLRQVLRSARLGLVALRLPTRRPFNTLEGLEDRLSRADRAFSLAYSLGTNLVLAHLGGLPPEGEAPRRTAFATAVAELAGRAEHRGVRLAMATGADDGPTLKTQLDAWGHPALATSIDPAELLRFGHDPARTIVALGPWVAHAYASEVSRSGTRPTIAHPRGFGFPPGALDWEEYLGSLEEVDYRGYLTFLPDPTIDVAPQFQAFLERVRRF
jgi:sugar phosphate isomerase/epimerase